MTEKQRQAMIRFHERAAKAYRSLGQVKQAEAAQRQADKLKQA